MTNNIINGSLKTLLKKWINKELNVDGVSLVIKFEVAI